MTTRPVRASSAVADRSPAGPVPSAPVQVSTPELVWEGEGGTVLVASMSGGLLDPRDG